MVQTDGQVIVIGGGAAGFFGAIACAEAHPDRRVILLEAGQQPLGKVRISGGGRCNVTHACFEPGALVQNYPRGGKALRGPFTRFQPKDTVAWFQRRGVTLKTEPDGRMFPITDSSETIVECLWQGARRSGVEIRLGSPVVAVEARSEGFEVALRSGDRLRCDRLLLATGSQPQGHRIAQSLGHHIEPPVPSLFTFNVPDPALRALAGVALDAAHLRLSLGTQKFEQTGPLLVTHWGLSGPAVLKLSAWAARSLHECRYQTTLQINWLPGENLETVRQTLVEARSQMPQRTLGAHRPVPLPRRLWDYFVSRAQLQPETRWAELSNKSLNHLALELVQGQYPVRGKSTFKEEFVTCGGVSLKEVNFKTLESRLCAGLYFAGEVLDIDGVTGGFNFQSAWTTAWLAGQAMGD